MLTISAILCFLYLLKELYLWLGWLFAYRGTVEEEQQTDPIQLRQIERDGFVYVSPTQYEDFQNNTFEWGIKRFRVGGEGLEEDKTFGKTTALAHERSINHDKVLYIVDDGDDQYNTNTNDDTDI